WRKHRRLRQAGYSTRTLGDVARDELRNEFVRYAADFGEREGFPEKAADDSTAKPARQAARKTPQHQAAQGYGYWTDEAERWFGFGGLGQNRAQEVRVQGETGFSHELLRSVLGEGREHFPVRIELQLGPGLVLDETFVLRAVDEQEGEAVDGTFRKKLLKSLL